MSLLSMGFLTGCSAVVDEDTPCSIDKNADEMMSMSFRLISNTSSPLTKTDDQDHEEIDSDYPYFEDAIDFSDLGMFLFLGKGDDARMIFKVSDFLAQSGTDLEIVGSPGVYTVNMKILKTTLEEYLGHEILSSSLQVLDFRILLLANCYSNSQNSGNFNNITGTTYREIIEEVSNWRYTLFGNVISSTYGNSGDLPLSRICTDGDIPMFGTKTFSVTESDIYYSRPEERIDVGDINMLRAVAKVRVIDNIEDKDENGYPKIEEVKVVTGTNIGYSCPYDAINYSDGNQVHNANIYSENAVATTYNLGYLSQNDKSMRIGYIPEQAIESTTPRFRIRVSMSALATGQANDPETKIYEVPMSGYDGEIFEDWQGNILRNHIYTLSVDEVNTGTPAKITVNVADWTTSSLTLDYSDNVSSTDIQWDTNTYVYDADADGIILKPFDDTPIDAVGSFRLTSPVGATWNAYLIQTEGPTGAFEFNCDTQGTIDPNKTITLKIHATNPSPEVNSRAILQVVVTLPSSGDGKFLEAGISGGDQKNITIIQNQQ